MRSETSKKNLLLTNTLVIAITELVFMLGGMQIMSWILFAIDSALNLGTDIQGDFVYEMLTFALFLIPTGFCLIYMRITKHESLQVFRKGSLFERFLSLFAGLAIGFITNGALSLLAGLTGSVKITFHCFTPYMVLILPFCFIQCTCEEVLLRGYVPQYMEGRHDWSSVAFVSGALFIFHHYLNMVYYGFSSAFCLNVFLYGVMMYLVVRGNGNFWICCGFHTAWNYTQQYLFGLPNSGLSSSYALFLGSESKDTFFYNTVFGLEGSWITTIVLSLLIMLLIYYCGRKQKEAEHGR